MKTKLPIANRILAAFSIILILTLPILSVHTVFAADVTLPFQDGFESGDFSKWSVIAGGSVTSGDAYNGTYKAVFSGGYIQATFSSAPVDQCFMRAYVLLNTIPTGYSTSIFGVYKLSGNYMAEAGVANVGGTLYWTLRYYNSGASYKVVSAMDKPVLGQWYCVEVEGKANSASNAEARIYVDGNELTDVSQTGLNNTQQINCGYLWMSGGSSGTVWYDDVVIATSYIGPEPVSDITPPVFGSIAANTNLVSAPCSFDCLISDNVNVSTYIFSTNNTGTWTNDTAVIFSSFYSSTAAWANVTKTLNETVGDVVSYMWYANDTSNNWSTSGQYNLTLTVKTMLFEDGFESGDFSKWSVIAGGSVTSGSAYDGTYKAVFSSGYIQARFTAAPVSDCFMRAYVLISTAPSIGYSTSIFGVYQLGGYYMAEAGVKNVGGTLEWTLRYYDSNGTTDISHTVVSAMDKPVLGQWYCVEVEGKANSASNAEARIYVDGNELTDVSQTGLNNTQQINCGYIWISGSSSGATVWYDDVAIDTAYVSPGHDIAVSAIAASKTVVGQDYSSVVDATIENQGYFTETFNATVYANTTVIGTFMNVTLASGTSTTLIFTWNTTGFAYGNYIISAYAQPVPSETNTTNNSFTGGVVTVTIPGDLNGDFKVSLTDLVTLARAYRSQPGDLKWNPNADIDGEGIVGNGSVGLSDLVLLAHHYGQHYP